MGDLFTSKAEKHTQFAPSMLNIVQRPMRGVMWRGNERGTLVEAFYEGGYDVKNIYSNACSMI